ncbi:MAG: type II toxin-antitoxin system RelE/ParE family toxin [Erysipelotrichaceae bacterium]|nr:type II toxin-antitoxin system RelE/ParE family toxin [Erysipelotrichaceae bacterium]
MGYRLEITEIAANDIDNVLGYIKDILSNPKAASSLLTKIEEKTNVIIANPYLFSDCSRYFIEDSNIRRARAGEYFLIYRVSESDKTVQILRFVHQRRNTYLMIMKQNEGNS